MDITKTAYNNVKSHIGMKKYEYKQKFLDDKSEINKEIFQKTHEIYNKLLEFVQNMERLDED